MANWAQKTRFLKRRRQSRTICVQGVQKVTFSAVPKQHYGNEGKRFLGAHRKDFTTPKHVYVRFTRIARNTQGIRCSTRGPLLLAASVACYTLMNIKTDVFCREPNLSGNTQMYKGSNCQEIGLTAWACSHPHFQNH